MRFRKYVIFNCKKFENVCTDSGHFSTFKKAEIVFLSKSPWVFSKNQDLLVCLPPNYSKPILQVKKYVVCNHLVTGLINQ